MLKPLIGKPEEKYIWEEKDIFYRHSKKVPHQGDLGETFIFPFSAGLFAALFIKKELLSGKWSGRWADQRAAVLGMVPARPFHVSNWPLLFDAFYDIF